MFVAENKLASEFDVDEGSDIVVEDSDNKPENASDVTKTYLSSLLFLLVFAQMLTTDE